MAQRHVLSHLNPEVHAGVDGRPDQDVECHQWLQMFVLPDMFVTYLQAEVAEG